MLSKETIAALYAPKTPRENTSPSKGFVFVRDPGTGKIVRENITKMGDYNFGTFEGRVGSTRRSAKGRTVRLPNGRRKYQNPLVPWNPEKAVIAYKV